MRHGQAAEFMSRHTVTPYFAKDYCGRKSSSILSDSASFQLQKRFSLSTLKACIWSLLTNFFNSYSLALIMVPLMLK